MKIDFNRLDDLNARMTLVVEYADYGPKLDENIKKYSKKVAIKGFRSGKTPKSVLTKMYGKGMLEETVNGIKATKLELIPKDKKARDYVAKIELWIPIGQSYAIQQRVTQPNGDFDLQIYNDAKLNPPLPSSAFDFVAPPGTKQKVMN